MDSPQETRERPDSALTPPGLQALIELAADKRAIVAFTGAGISTESGIPDYRGPNGVWATQNPPTIGDFLTNPDSRRLYWESRLERFPKLIATQPNQGHLALTRLYEAGLLTHVITQNIDGLHQRAGLPSDHVIELHGSALEVQCLNCGSKWDGVTIHTRQLGGEVVPHCESCGGFLRASTVLFGESLPVGVMAKSREIARSADLLIVIGSSLVVQPAARIPLIARQSGAMLGIVNLEETPLDRFADVVVRGRAGTSLNELARARLVNVINSR
ncbi:NAD-dependent protein deacetylase [soil metagenome]